MKKINLKNRYYLFSYDDHYPSGGMGDIHETFERIDQVTNFFKDVINCKVGDLPRNLAIDNLELLDKKTGSLFIFDLVLSNKLWILEIGIKGNNENAILVENPNDINSFIENNTIN